MRTELLAIWDKPSASREQLLAHLHDWIARAESSGNESSGMQTLHNAAARVRSIAPTTAMVPTTV